MWTLYCPQSPTSWNLKSGHLRTSKKAGLAVELQQPVQNENVALAGGGKSGSLPVALLPPPAEGGVS